jgi:hypothetical protein
MATRFRTVDHWRFDDAVPECSGCPLTPKNPKSLC